MNAEQCREALLKAIQCLRASTEYKIGNPEFEQAEAGLSIISQTMPTAVVIGEVVQNLNWQITQAQNIAHLPGMSARVEKMRGWVSSLSGASASPAAPEGAKAEVIQNLQLQADLIQTGAPYDEGVIESVMRSAAALLAASDKP